MGAQVNCERNPFWTLLSPMKQWAPIQIRFGVNTTRSEPRGTQVNPESVYSGPSRSEWNPWQPRGSCCYWFRPVWTRGESRAKLVKSELTWSKRPIGTHTDTRTQKDRHTHTHTQLRCSCARRTMTLRSGRPQGEPAIYHRQVHWRPTASHSALLLFTFYPPNLPANRLLSDFCRALAPFIYVADVSLW